MLKFLKSLYRLLLPVCSTSRKMIESLGPPPTVKGMTKWDPLAFSATFEVPYIETKATYVGAVKKVLGPVLLKVPNLPHIQPGATEGRKKILLDPMQITTIQELIKKQASVLDRCEVVVDGISVSKVDFTIDNFKVPDLLDAVLEDKEKGIPSLGSYSIIGHIVHLNLKEFHLPHKEVIGHILLRLKQIRTVVNKVNTIDNTFRNFSMEVLAGTRDDFQVQVKENGTRFEFDFSQVYWNPRLSTEHAKLVQLLFKEDVLFDVFAGVGPFAIPASKKCAEVYANDLNPNSFKWLERNKTLNKVKSECFQCTNLDGREFIKTIVKERLKKGNISGQAQVAMNLPALATEFLDAFSGLFQGCDVKTPIRVHVYAFHKGNQDQAEQALIKRCEEALKGDLEEFEVVFVRNVAPSKDMYRISFQIPGIILFGTNSENAKRLKLGK